MLRRLFLPFTGAFDCLLEETDDLASPPQENTIFRPILVFPAGEFRKNFLRGLNIRSTFQNKEKRAFAE
jgi:hypothetical protein